MRDKGGGDVKKYFCILEKGDIRICWKNRAKSKSEFLEGDAFIIRLLKDGWKVVECRQALPETNRERKWASFACIDMGQADSTIRR